MIKTSKPFDNAKSIFSLSFFPIFHKNDDRVKGVNGTD